jgi:hypothetical protein
MRTTYQRRLVPAIATTLVFIISTPAWAAATCDSIAVTSSEVDKARAGSKLKELAVESALKAYGGSPSPIQSETSTSIAAALASVFGVVPQLSNDTIAEKLTKGLKAVCDSIDNGDIPTVSKSTAFTAAGLNDIHHVDEKEELDKQISKYPSSSEEFGKGDKLILRAHAPIFKPTQRSAGCLSLPIGGEGKEYCLAPLGSELKIDTPISSEGKARVRFTCIPGTKKLADLKKLRRKQQAVPIDDVRIGGMTWTQFFCDRAFNNPTVGLSDSTSIADLKKNHPDAIGIAEVGPEYEVDITELSGYGRHQFGWTYGALIVPYKFHTSDKSFASNATVAGFAGYNLGYNAIQFTPVLSAGISTVSVSSTNDKNETVTDNKASASAAVGVVFTFTRTGRFQAGILTGWDWAGENSGYNYNGKPWIAISFGLDLTK